MRPLALLLLLAGCASVPSPGGHETIACHVVPVSDPRAAGYTVYSCPRPFAVAHYRDSGCEKSTRQPSGAKGPYTPCGWVNGFIDRRAREIFVWDLNFSDTLEHELQHAALQISDDR